ncbi:MAG: hypothetical protein S4CHLAM81_06650 [Chlamydiales bacterium]|nr:hypothetical protein [Chlamydiales bacterium]MCH9635449.1 hypothetical protein [Chlamydiales bacterium]
MDYQCKIISSVSSSLLLAGGIASIFVPSFGRNVRLAISCTTIPIGFFSAHALCMRKAKSTLFSFGEALQQPFLFQAEGITAVIKGRRSAKSVAGAALTATIALPLLFGLTTLLGSTLRAFATRQAPRFKEQGRGTFSTRHGLTVMTYNTGLLPNYISNVNNLRPVEERVAEIKKCPPTGDIHCFQEVFDHRARQKLVELLPGHVIYDVDESQFGFGSGLVVASLLPISNIAYRRFSVAAKEDRLANKGVLAMTVKVNSQKRFQLYATHLQARDDCKSVRALQLQELMKFVGERHQNGIEDVIAGDLNITGSVTLPGFVDANPDQGTWYEQNETWGTDDWDKEVSDKNYDHILTRNPIQRTSVIHLDAEKSGISDHLPFTATIRT